MITVRSLIYSLVSSVWAVVFLTLCLPLLLAPARFSSIVGQIWLKVSFTALAVICGLRYEIRGRENMPDGPCLIAAKHQSAWDTFVFGQILREPSFVVKRELLRVPLFGWYLRRAGVVAVDRKGGANALKQMVREARPLLEAGRPIIIFPEGTRLSPGARGPYHPGVAALYDLLKVPVVPVALNSGFFWGKRAFLKKPGLIVMEFLPPIAPGLPRKEFIPLLQRQIEDNSERLLAEAQAAARQASDVEQK